MKRMTKIVQAFKEGLSRRRVARIFGINVSQVDRALRARVQPGGGRTSER